MQPAVYVQAKIFTTAIARVTSRMWLLELQKLKVPHQFNEYVFILL